MRKLIIVLMAGALLASMIAASVSAADLGGNQAWFNVKTNVDTADIYFDNDFKGTTTNGVLVVAVYTTATPYIDVRATASGYDPAAQALGNYPAAGETRDIYLTLQPNPTPTSPPAPIGGDQGTYTIYCNVDGAGVYFNDDYKGEIANGELVVSVYTTGTPYTTYTVKKDGYTPFTAQISDYPAAGENVKLHATLTPVASTPLSPLTLISALCIAGLGAVLLTRRE